MKKIFIASSSEALPQVEQIANVLEDIDGVKPIKWNKAFEPGKLIFETIEKIPTEVSGALILASPDDDLEIRNRNVKTPRINSMIEFGYFSAILGRENVAICKYDNVEIASDLDGFNFISMGEFVANAPIQGDPLEKLTEWVGDLPNVAVDVPLTQLLHGYSGRWLVESNFKVWRYRDMTLSNDDYSQFTGTLDLLIPHNGNGGFGTLLSTNLNLETEGFIMEANFVAEVRNIVVTNSGSITFDTKIKVRKIQKKRGEEPQVRGMEDELHGARIAKWSMVPSDKPKQLVGEFKIMAGDRIADHATCTLDKEKVK